MNSLLQIVCHEVNECSFSPRLEPHGGSARLWVEPTKP